ncbi:Thiazole biosynthesis protein ThiH [uncultured delta proteobacterium]|uniref:Thiazole biosynthesis protein ThiH n=1 Tax=uncultured delta proteobacterium TaxID=34034 RepID=A0A212J697_9DELT|nr:Thiazole biosynthesis protein ThiH [uncultured delta proteobacterium]
MTKQQYTPMADGFYPELARGAAVMEALDPDRVTEDDVRKSLGAGRITERDFLVLLSPAAEGYLEPMARRARDETIRHFGKTIQLFTPLYLANFCTNRCVYCGFNTNRSIPRQMLTLEEVEAEAKAIAATGLRKILALTGDAPAKTGARYLASCIEVLARYFPSVGIEVPSMTVEEYALVVAAGADSMTMFQETYNEVLYEKLHPAGPKRDFGFRLDAPQRAVMGGMRSVNLGALLGLDHWRRDMFYTGLHAAFLQERYPEQEVSVSLPRMRPCGEKPTTREERDFAATPVSDTHFVQALLAFRCFMPQAGITLSTREPAFLRDKLIPLGVTRISAGVCTAVGGHVAADDAAEREPQFDISDPRSVDEMVAVLEAMGYQPVFTDWVLSGKGEAALTAGIGHALGQTLGKAGSAGIDCNGAGI